LLPELPLPLYLYNMPEMTKVQFAPETLRRLAQHEKIIGVKDSSADLARFKQCVEVAKARSDWRVFMGPEHLLADALRLGGHGGVNGGALIEPSLFVRLYEAVRRGDTAQLAPLQQRLLQLGQVYSIIEGVSGVINGLKSSLSLMGIGTGLLAPPLTQFTPAQRAQVQAILQELGVL
jgi:4-hydroxy-tetrahydrodipicolinate synthase